MKSHEVVTIFTILCGVICRSSLAFSGSFSKMCRTAYRTALSDSTDTGYANQKDYLSYLATISALPEGFSVGNSRFNFKPFEVDKTLPMNVTIIMADKPTSSFAAMFTSNQFPGGPIIIGKERLKSSEFMQAIVVNNKISNVCPGGSPDKGAGDSDTICEATSKILKLQSKHLVLPSSTGIE
jgi:glutamate N-acetyltransferase/amino-acid N-acetyltransferase